MPGGGDVLLEGFVGYVSAISGVQVERRMLLGCDIGGFGCMVDG